MEEGVQFSDEGLDCDLGFNLNLDLYWDLDIDYNGVGGSSVNIEHVGNRMGDVSEGGSSSTEGL